MLRAFGISDKGRVRPTNEDCFAVDESLRLCVVADGLGGHNAGEVAARIAVDAVVDFVREREMTLCGRDSSPAQGGSGVEWPFGREAGLSDVANVLRNAIYLAHLQVLESAAVVDAYAGMATTLVASIAVDGRLVVAHVGDSRLYLLSARRLCQVTNDDSWMASVLAADPRADRSVLQHHPMRNVLTNVVGARTRTDVHVTEAALAGGDRLLLSTDGVHGALHERRIEQILADAPDPPEAARQLVAAALSHGSRDNCTAVVADYVP